MADLSAEIVPLLEAWSGAHKLIEQALESCETAIRNAAKDDAEWFPEKKLDGETLAGHNLLDIQLRFERQALIFKNARLPYPYFETRIGLYIANSSGSYLNDLEPIGNYRLIVTLDGEVDDDYLVCDEQQSQP